MPQQDQEFQEKFAVAEAAVFAQHGYVAEDGSVDERGIEDKILARLLGAEAHSTGERRTVAVPREALMHDVYPNLPGEGEFSEQEDPELAEALYSKLSTSLWMMLTMNPDGAIQQRLNGDHALVLCRMPATKTRPVSVYVTRNGKCIDEDYWAPDMKAISRALGKAARKATLVAERIPEHGPKLRRSLKSSTNNALTAADHVVRDAIEAQTGSGGSDE